MSEEKPKPRSHVLAYFEKKAAEDSEKKEDTTMLESFLSAFGLNILFRRK